MHPTLTRALRVSAAVTTLSTAAAAQAAIVDVTVTVRNLAPVNSISFAPLHFGFNGGTFDAFSLGGVATAPIISVAEGGAGDVWQTAFGAADPGATRGTVGGLLTPGATRSLTVRVDTALNPFFTFGAMAVPSNDFFIGNDDPTAYRVLSASGGLNFSSINIKARDIWDAGSEVFDPAAAAFVGNNGLRTPQNSVLALNFGEFAGYNGLTTGAGYIFNSGLSANSDVYSISFGVTAVPEPGTYAMLLAGLAAIGWAARHRGPAHAGA